MYVGNVYDFEGNISGYLEGAIAGVIFNGSVEDTEISKFTGYVEADDSVDNETGYELEDGKGATIDPQAPVVADPDADTTDEGDAYLEDDYHYERDYSVRLPVQFGDDNMSVHVDATWPSQGFYDLLQDNIKSALVAGSVPTLDTTSADSGHSINDGGAGTKRAITHEGVMLSDPRLRMALTTIVQALTAPDVTIHSVVTRNSQGSIVEAPAIRQMLGV